VSGSRVPVWSGTLSANMAGRGPWTRASLHGSLSLVNFYLLGEPFEELSIGVDANWPQWNVEAHVRHLADERLDATLNGSGAEWVQASLRGDDWQLERLRGASSLGLKGRATGSVDVNGPVRQLGGRVAIGLSGLEWRERSVGRVRFAAEGVKGNWHFDGSVEERIQLHGDLVGSGRYPATLRLEWDHADLVPFLTKDTEVRSDSSGTIELRAPLLAARELEGDVQIAALSIAHGEQQLATTEPIRLRGRRGRFTIESLSLAGKDAELTGEGDLSTSGEIDVRVHAGCDLGWLEVLLGPVRSSRGRAALDVAIQRSAMGHWQLAGSGSVEDGGIDLGLPFGLEDVHGRFSLTGSSLRIDELKGDTAGGTFAVDGSIDLDSGPALTWVFSDVSPTLLADLESEFSGHGWVRGSWDDLTVAGDIEVSRALYEKRLGLTDLIPWFRRELAPVRSTAPGKGTVRLDLHVAAADEIFIDTTVAKAELRADLHVGGTVGQVTVAGPIEMLSGEVAFRNRKFTIESGVVEFQPALGLNPSLNITAESAIETPSASYTVRVQVVGTAEKYQVLLSSDDPSLSETDLASLVSFGKTSAQLQQGGGGVSVNDLIALAPGLYRDDIEQQVRRVLPIDRVQFESAYSRSTGSYEPRVTVAKDLTERFTGLVSTTFGVENRHGVQLEYRLSPRVWLSGKWESETTTEAGAFGGDVKFRYAFHRPRFSLLMPWRGWFDGELW